MRQPSRALKIRYFQNLYKSYSKLNLSWIEDRPVAIAGLVRRLQTAFETSGGFGIFDDGADGGLFHRSLLWRRDQDSYLTPIVFPLERRVKVPTWSWMAYKGGIDYLDPVFRTTDWEKNEIRPPWTRGNSGSGETTPHDTGTALSATVRNFFVARRKADDVELVYDTERTASDGQRAQCVIVARSKEEGEDQDKKHYVLLVVPTGGTTARGQATYKRVGAGFMLGRYIVMKEPGIKATIY